jgi:ATP-dependent Clp protease protease subunit
MNNKNEEKEEEDPSLSELGEEILKAIGIESPSDVLSNHSIEYLNRIRSRKIYLFGDVCTETIVAVIYQIHILETINSDEDIELVINSGGGDVTDCLALIDTMNASPCDFKITVLGFAASAACLIASNGANGKRCAGPNSEFMFHEIFGTFESKTSDVVYYKKESERIQKKFNKIFSSNTGRSLSEIREEFYGSKDKFMTAGEARKFGIIDRVLGNKKIRREKSKKIVGK